MYGLIFDVLEKLFIEEYGSFSWDSVIDRTNSWWVSEARRSSIRSKDNRASSSSCQMVAARLPPVPPGAGTRKPEDEHDEFFQQTSTVEKEQGHGIMVLIPGTGKEGVLLTRTTSSSSPLIIHRPDSIKREAWSLNRKYDDDLFLYMATMGAEIAGTCIDDLMEKTGFYFLDYIRYYSRCFSSISNPSILVLC
jgi:hypothetical protein